MIQSLVQEVDENGGMLDEEEEVHELKTRGEGSSQTK